MSIHFRFINLNLLEEIQEQKEAIREKKEEILTAIADIEHIEYRIRQTQLSLTHEYLPTMISIQKFLRTRLKNLNIELDIKQLLLSVLINRLIIC